MKLDSLDYQIINQLKNNSRLSVRDIAKKVNSRPSTVHQRIKKLKKEGVIEKFTVKLSNKLMQENFIVFMLVNTENELPETVFNDEHIKEVFGITGEYDLLLKLKFKDIEEFNDFIIKFRKKHGLKKTVTLVSTINIKEEI